MLAHEILKQAERQHFPTCDGVNPSTSSEFQGYVAVDAYVAIPVRAVASFYDQNADLEVFDQHGVSFATLCFAARCSLVEPEHLTKWQYVAYLTEVTAENCGSPCIFEQSYLVVDLDRAEEYLKSYATSAEVWGGFSHSPVIYTPAKRFCSQIDVCPRVKSPTKHHEEAFRRYVNAQNGFDRYLKLYHTLELLFDFVLLKRIQSINGDMADFAKILNEYSHSELDRLNFLLATYVDDAESIAQSLQGARNFPAICFEIFQEFTKKGNPCKDETIWDQIWLLVTEQNLANSEARKLKFLKEDRQYTRFTLSLAAYWIYRTRSSIAHNRIGEYILSDTAEPFVTEFMEPLLLNVVRQTFSSESLPRPD